MYDLFYKCVDFIKYLSEISGYSYEEVNVILFVIIHPIITLLLLIWVIILLYKIKVRNPSYSQRI